MKWKNRRKSSNVNRGSGAPVVFGGGIGGLILVLILYFLGADPSVINNKNVNETQENLSLIHILHLNVQSSYHYRQFYLLAYL